MQFWINQENSFFVESFKSISIGGDNPFWENSSMTRLLFSAIKVPTLGLALGLSTKLIYEVQLHAE